jgi:hypothetical protein
MIKTDIDTAIDDERRKTGTGFIAVAEKTRYENQALQDISRKVDFYEQEATQDFTFSPEVALSAVNALSSVAPNLKTTGAIITVNPLSSTTQHLNRIRPEDFQHILSGNYFAQAGSDLWVRSGGKSGDTLRVRYVANYVAKTSGGTLSAAMRSDDDEPINDIDPEAVVAFVLWKIFRKEGKKDDARESKKRYDEILKSIIQNNLYRRAGTFDRQTIEDAQQHDWTNHIGT